MLHYLPEINGLNQGIRKGRNVYEGYQRGWGLQFDNLKEKVLADPLYNDAYDLAKDRTILSEENRMNLFLILRFFLHKLPFGHIIEYGSYKGGNAIFMAFIIKNIYPGMSVYALDSYQGMPETNKSIDAHNTRDFDDVDLASLQDRKEELQLNNLILVKGFFENTSPKILTPGNNISLAHIDCDIAQSCKYSYTSVKPFMVNGGYIVFDDANISSCMGATEVVEDLCIRRDGLNSEQIWPHFVFRSFR